MKRSLLYLSIFIITSCGSRSGGNEQSGTQISTVSKGPFWQTDGVVDLEKDCEISIFDIIDSVEVVQLETGAYCLMGDIGKVLSYKGRYYIFDDRQQSLLCFNQNGKFIRKIGERGRGPGEYEHLGDVVIDPFNEQLLLVVPFGYILCYDFDGNFITRIEAFDAVAINEVHVLDADRWLFVSLNNHQILYFSKKENRITERLYERIPHFSPLYRTYIYRDSVFFSPIFKNETLNMSDNNRRVAYLWDFGAKNNRPRRINAIKHETENMNIRSDEDFLQFIKLQSSSINYNILFTRETSRYRMAVLEYKNDFMHIVFDKREGKTVVFRKTQEDIRWVYSGYTFFEDMVITYERSLSKVRDWTYYAETTLTPKHLQILKAHNPDTDNPFLVIYHLKK